MRRSQGGSTISSVLSVDERDLRSKSISDLVLALKGASGVSRLRVRSQQGGAGDAVVPTAFLRGQRYSTRPVAC